MEKIYNYLLKVEYDGTGYSGWQYQKNSKSIQEKIEKALSKILKLKIKIIGAGRTDKGVHAFGQYANFKIDHKIEDKKTFLNSLNFFLRDNLISIIEQKGWEDFLNTYVLSNSLLSSLPLNQKIRLTE